MGALKKVLKYLIGVVPFLIIIMLMNHYSEPYPFSTHHWFGGHKKYLSDANVTVSIMDNGTKTLVIIQPGDKYHQHESKFASQQFKRVNDAEYVLMSNCFIRARGGSTIEFNDGLIVIGDGKTMLTIDIENGFSECYRDNA